MTPPAMPRTSTVWFALVTDYLVWGSTYLAIRVIVEDAPPLLAMGVRFVVAAAVLGVFLAARYGVAVLRVQPRQLASAGLIGGLLLLCGNGGVAVAEQTVPSGVAALLVAATPLWLVMMRSTVGDRPRGMSLLGTGLGFVGIAVLAQPGAHDGDIKAWGLLTVIGATFCWALGSFWSSRIPMPRNAFVATFYEMTAGGVGLLVAAGVGGELDDVAVSDLPAKTWLWLAYLVVFGSLVAFTAYVWLLEHAPISLTATYAYVNPVVAVILGALVLSEPVTLPIVLGGAVVVVGVGLVVSTERPRRTTAAQQLEPAEAEQAAAGRAAG